MRCICSLSSASAPITTATGLPRNGLTVKTSTCLKLSVFMDYLFRALGVDDRLGEAVHRLNFLLAAVLRPAAELVREQLGLDVATHLGGQGIEAMVGLGDVASQRGDAVAQQHH